MSVKTLCLTAIMHPWRCESLERLMLSLLRIASNTTYKPFSLLSSLISLQFSAAWTN